VNETHQIRAAYDARTIRVYQAYGEEIADAALAHGTFVPPFKMGRMTWIKPSFLWMMYRAGWGYKDEGQRRILAIDISREGFEWALAHSCSSHPPPLMSQADWEKRKAEAPVRIQWDPERDIFLQPQPHRSIQIGLGPVAAELYVHNWIRRISDITLMAHNIHALVQSGQLEKARAMLPPEKPYPYDSDAGL
jgi:hypothetical protein